MMAKQDAVWTVLDAATLGGEHTERYEVYKALYREMKAARKAFEDGVNDAARLPQGKRMIFGYNFGRLSAAIVDDDRKAPASKSGSLADFLAGQVASGRRA